MCLVDCFFLVYITTVKYPVYVCVDDNKICKIICSLSESSDLQNDIDCLLYWCTQWRMSLQCDKFVTVHCGHFAHNSPSYFMNNTFIQSSSKHRDLGITLFSKFSWSNPYNHISRSSYYSLPLIRRSFSSTLPLHKKILLYLSLVHSHLTYCLQIWRQRFFQTHPIFKTYSTSCN